MNSISFRYRLFLIICIVAIVPITVMAGILYRRAVFEITSQITDVVVKTLNFSIEYIEPSLQTIIHTSELILREEKIGAAAEAEKSMPYNDIVEYNKSVREILSMYIERIKSINSTFGFDSFYVYLPRHRLLLDSKTTFYENINPEYLDFVSGSRKNRSWSITKAVDFYTLNQIDRHRFGYNRLLTYVNQVTDEKGEVILYLAANVRFDFLSGYYNRIEKGIPGNFLILDTDGNFIANSHEEQGADFGNRISAAIQSGKESSGSLQTVFADQRWFVVYSVSGYTRWKYALAVPAKDVFGQIYNIRNFFVLVVLLITALILPLCFIVSGSVYRPLGKLIAAMREVEGGRLDIRINDRREDEYRLVFRSFNKMAGELNKLVEDLANEQVLKKQAEINMLQAQINPHFLYNTLDSIYSIAVMYKVEEISKIVAALSKFFRIALSEGKQDITLKEELDIIKNYLIIQNIRFNNKIEYRISVPEEYKDISIPKLLLQPIVENSIFHGMERKKGKGHLSISCQTEEDTLCIRISDDGVGMTEEHLRSLRDSINRDRIGDTDNFALRTLNKQLILRYGAQYGLHLDSAWGKGTTVAVSIPIRLSV